jgi:hypothetical protein
VWLRKFKAVIQGLLYTNRTSYRRGLSFIGVYVVLYEPLCPWVPAARALTLITTVKSTALGYNCIETSLC